MDSTHRFKWTLITCTCTVDELNARTGCSVTVFGQNIWVLGGGSHGSRVSVPNTETLQWRDVRPSLGNASFTPFHCAASFEDRIFICGIRLGAALRSVDDVFAFGVVTNELTRVPTYNTQKRPSYGVNSVVEMYAPTSTLAFVCGSLYGGKLHLLDLTTWT